MRCIALVVSLLCVLPAVADDGGLAGPTWDEGGSDKAGASAQTASRTKSVAASDSSGSTVTMILGETGTISLVATLPDSIDLYEIYIFNSQEFDVNTQGSSFDTRLFLFKKVVNADGSLGAIPLAANNNKDSTVEWSRLHNGTTGGGIPLLTVGAHYLAVTGNSVPTTCPRSQISSELFNFNSDNAAQIILPVVNGELCDWICDGNSVQGNCPAGQIRDCSGHCCPANWVGDGYCDDGAYTFNGVPIFLNCDQYCNDGGDCGTSNGATGTYKINVVGGIRLSRPATCDDAPVLGEGTYSYSTVNTTAEGSSNNIGLDNICNVDASIRSPTWFQLDACSGETTVKVQPSTTGTAAYGFVVYTGSCGHLHPIACSEQLGTTGRLHFNTDACETYFVAYGPLKPNNSPENPAAGPGSLIISCIPGQRSADLNGDGLINGSDLALLLSQWGS